MAPEIATVEDHLYWSYANLGMSHMLISKGKAKQGRLGFMVRAKLFNGLKSGTMRLGSLADDERLKLVLPQACCYCGSSTRLSIDHLVPSLLGGSDSGDNLVWACRSCNSSKGAFDLLAWYEARAVFPPILLLRRYLKLAIAHSIEHSWMSLPISQAPDEPFSIRRAPQSYPDPCHLKLWIIGVDAPSKEQPSQVLPPR